MPEQNPSSLHLCYHNIRAPFVAMISATKASSVFLCVALDAAQLRSKALVEVLKIIKVHDIEAGNLFGDLLAFILRRCPLTVRDGFPSYGMRPKT